MKDFLLSCIIFGVTTILTLLLHSPFVPPPATQMILSFFILIMLITLTSYRLLKKYQQKLRFPLLFLSSCIVYLLILTTGGLYSPFLIILFLLALIISLVMSFPISLVYLAFSLLTVITGMFSYPETALLLINDPIKAGIYLLTFLIVLPLYHIITSRYHRPEKTLQHLSAEVNVEDSLLDEINELVLVTDTSFRILSVNDAVETYLHRSRSEMIDQPIFDIVYLQDQNGILLTKSVLDLQSDLKPQSPRIIPNLRLITTPVFADTVQVYMKPIPDFEGKVTQLLFVISDGNRNKKSAPVDDAFMHIRTRYEAMIETLKKHLKQLGSQSALYQFILITSIQEDLLNTQLLEEHAVEQKKTRVDLAKLAKQTLLSERDFAEAFRVKLQFSLPDFGEKDVSPLVTDIMKVNPEDFTGPFFTTTCDTQHVRLLIQKLLDVATLLASKEPEPIVELRIERHTPSVLTVSVTSPSPEITPEELNALSVKFYGLLHHKTNLNAGSGLEGYLVKTLCEKLALPFEIHHTNNPSRMQWTIQIPK